MSDTLRHCPAALAAIAFTFSGAAGAIDYFEPVTMTSVANFNMQQDKNALYPTGTFVTRYAVPFEIPATGFNAWGSGDARLGGSGRDGTWSFELPVNRDGVKTVYLLAGTDWGAAGAQRFTVAATFEGGRRVVWQLVDGVHLRDWNLFPTFASTISGDMVTEVFRVSAPLPVRDGNPDVLDMQILSIPDALDGLALEKLTFTDQRQTFVHSAFVAGVTLSYVDRVGPGGSAPVPEPGTAGAMLCGTILTVVLALRSRPGQRSGSSASM